MAIQGKQLADLAVSTAKIAANAVTSAKVDATVLVAAGTNPLTADWALGSHKLTGMSDPVDPQDAATKSYVDAVAQGQDVKASVRVATTAALETNTRTGNILTRTGNGALPAIDDVTLVLNDRLIVKNEATGANNGLYFVSALGSGAAPWTLTRTTDADTSAEVTAGLFTFVEEGAINADSGWTVVSNQPITLNTTAITFSQFSGAGTILAGAGLLKTGSTIDLVIGGTSGGLTANADDLQVNYAAVGNLAAADASAAGAGTGQLIPRADHKHLVSTAAPSAALAVGATAAAGSAATLIRSDATFSIPTGTPSNVGSANAAGSSSSFPHLDHVHAVPRPVTANKNMTASVTTSDGDAATATTVANANALGGYIGMRVNGIHYNVGDGTKVSVDAFISADGGVTARAFSAVVAGDSLRWNGSVAGFQLAATDRIDIQMDAF